MSLFLYFKNSPVSKFLILNFIPLIGIFCLVSESTLFIFSLAPTTFISKLVLNCLNLPTLITF